MHHNDDPDRNPSQSQSTRSALKVAIARLIRHTQRVLGHADETEAYTSFDVTTHLSAATASDPHRADSVRASARLHAVAACESLVSAHVSGAAVSGYGPVPGGPSVCHWSPAPRFPTIKKAIPPSALFFTRRLYSTTCA